MKIPASKVPAQVWADKARGRLSDLDSYDRECLRRWESSKQVYRMNGTLWDELTLDDTAELPMSVFRKLPYDCIFVQRHDVLMMPVVDGIIHVEYDRAGYFCWVDEEGLNVGLLHTSVANVWENGVRHINPEMSGSVAPIRIKLEDGVTIGEYLDMSKSTVHDVASAGADVLFGGAAKSVTDTIASDYAVGIVEQSGLRQLLGTLMYISSKEADVRTVYVPQKNQSRKSRQTDCTVHDVGFRIAPQLAEVRRVYEHEAKGRDGGDTGRHVAPHVRRGHWHGYWTGPRENPTGLEIKWVAPTIVNGSRGELEGTVHEVGDRDGRYTLKSTQRECGRAAEQLNGAGRSEEQARDGKSDR